MESKEYGNIRVIGNSGVGKSTLINAVIGSDEAETGRGSEGTTKDVRIYPADEIGLRLVDTAGFEPSLLKRTKVIRDVQKWSKQSVTEEDHNINVIWFCVDGTSSKLFGDTIKSLMQATSLWKSVPVIVVITKSYSVPEREQNIEMVKQIFYKQKKAGENLRDIIPVVASPYILNEDAYAAPYGIPELIEKTIALLPEGRRAAVNDVNAYKLKRRRMLAQSVVGAATTAGVVVGAVPIPFPDALILSPTEIGEVNAIASIYGIKKNDKSKDFINTIIQVGTVSAVARSAITALKAIPGLNIAASAVNAVIAGSIVAAIGEGSVYAFEQIYLGKKSLDDIDWIKKLMENKLTKGFIENMTKVLEQVADGADKDQIAKAIKKVFFG
jgi:uncharacterized protein (DUF697 family)/GTP-binding protein EngB required for normal cell division